MAECYSSSGERIEIGRRIAAGGEGAVHALPGHAGMCAKIYHENHRTSERRQKLECMVARPPKDPTAATGHRSIAWPQALLFADPQRRKFVGFMMPLLSPDADSALNYFQPETRTTRYPGFNFRYLLRAGRNLAAAVAALHEAGYRVGDLNESNVRITPEALVTLIDCDSFQVPSPQGGVFRCTVGKPEYTAPELLGVPFEKADRTEETDAFALAVMLFQLLMQGWHPYAGPWQDPGKSVPLVDRIRGGHYAHGGSRLVKPPPKAPQIGILPGEIRKAFDDAFVRGTAEPARRPRAADWVAILGRAEARLRTCRENSEHVFPDHLRTCPWCQLKRRGLEFFPSPRAGVQVPLPPAGTKHSPRQAEEEFRRLVQAAVAGGVLTEAHERHLRQAARNLGLERRFPALLERILRDLGVQRAAAAKNQARLDVTPQQVDFPLVRPGDKPQPVSISYVNKGAESLRATIRTEPPGVIRASPVVLTLNSGQFTLDLDTTALRWGYQYGGKVVIDYNGPDSPIVIPVRVPVAAKPTVGSRVEQFARDHKHVLLPLGAVIAYIAYRQGARPVEQAVLLLARALSGVLAGLFGGPTDPALWARQGEAVLAFAGTYALLSQRLSWGRLLTAVGLGAWLAPSLGAAGYDRFVSLIATALMPITVGRLTAWVMRCRALQRLVSRIAAEKFATAALLGMLWGPPILTLGGMFWIGYRASAAPASAAPETPTLEASSSAESPVFVGPGTADPQRVRQLQEALVALGFAPGKVDGVWGPRTERAVKALQRSQGWPETGQITVGQWQTITRLLSGKEGQK